MVDLKNISGIAKSSHELLEAVGFSDVAVLAKANTETLFEEISRANSVLNISKKTPTEEEIQKWVSAAQKALQQERDVSEPKKLKSQKKRKDRTATPKEEKEELPKSEELSEKASEIPSEPVSAEESSAQPVNHELVPHVAAMLARAPLAIPLPGRILTENHLSVSDIPPAILLSHCSGDIDIRMDERLPKIRSPKSSQSTNYIQTIEPTMQQDSDKLHPSRFHPSSGAMKDKPVLSAAKSPQNDRVTLLRAPRPETNKGKDPNSRSYIRGVLHQNPVHIYLGAFVTFLLFIAVPLAVIAAALLLLSSEMPNSFPWVQRWFIAFPASIPILFLFWLMISSSCSCRICGQKLFVQRSHRKNSKAHHLPFCGFIFPLCVHILLFRWFRCTHCGTPVRLKE